MYFSSTLHYKCSVIYVVALYIIADNKRIYILRDIICILFRFVGNINLIKGYFRISYRDWNHASCYIKIQTRELNCFVKSQSTRFSALIRYCVPLQMTVQGVRCSVQFIKTTKRRLIFHENDRVAFIQQSQLSVSGNLWPNDTPVINDPKDSQKPKQPDTEHCAVIRLTLKMLDNLLNMYSRFITLLDTN